MNKYFCRIVAAISWGVLFLMPAQLPANEATNVSDLLDKYVETRDKLESFVIKAKDVVQDCHLSVLNQPGIITLDLPAISLTVSCPNALHPCAEGTWGKKQSDETTLRWPRVSDNWWLVLGDN